MGKVLVTADKAESIPGLVIHSQRNMLDMQEILDIRWPGQAVEGQAVEDQAVEEQAVE